MPDSTPASPTPRARLRPARLAGLSDGTPAGADYPLVLLPAEAATDGRASVPLSEWTGDLPDGAEVLEYGPAAALRLLVLAASRERAARLAAWRARIEGVRNQLADRLAVERARDADGVGSMAGTVGAIGGDLLDPTALATVVGSPRGSREMDADRRVRLESMLAALDAELARDAGPAAIVLGPERALPREGVVRVVADDPCGAAAVRFDEEAGRLTRAAAALHTAELELADCYDPSRHDHIAARVDWRHLSGEELGLLPAIVAADDADRIVRDGMASLTRLLVSGRPVTVLVEVSATRNPGADPLGGFRVELGQLGMALRQAFVHQSTPAYATHCLDGFVRGLASGRPALHLLCSGCLDDDCGPGAWVVAASAVESRAHPLFIYDPDGGTTWAECLDVGGNPQPESDWAHHEVVGTPTPYTIADHALLDPALADHFAEPDAGEQERIAPVGGYLGLDPAEANRRVPGVAIENGAGPGWRTVSAPLLFSVQDRLRSWRSLRELAVESPAPSEAPPAGEPTAAPGADIAKVRDAAVRDAMTRLATRLLLGQGASAPSPDPAAAPPSTDASAAPAETTPAITAPAPADAAPSSGPWIESVLCTSCNDCIAMNNRLFVYDANQQAKIGDPRAGTFRQLLKAAEACPARCIHPGAPLNPDEPGLDKLVVTRQGLRLSLPGGRVGRGGSLAILLFPS